LGERKLKAREKGIREDHQEEGDAVKGAMKNREKEGTKGPEGGGLI